MTYLFNPASGNHFLASQQGGKATPVVMSGTCTCSLPVNRGKKKGISGVLSEVARPSVSLSESPLGANCFGSEKKLGCFLASCTDDANPLL